MSEQLVTFDLRTADGGVLALKIDGRAKLRVLEMCKFVLNALA